MKILLVSPAYPQTFWSMQHAGRFFHAPANVPPLGLLTVAAMLPRDWPLRLVDMSVEPLLEELLAWADVVFISAMESAVRYMTPPALNWVSPAPHYYAS